MTKEKSEELGIDQEGSTARTEAPAPNPLPHTDAYWAGADARCEEFSLDDNPYSVDGPAWREWNAGWAEHPHKGTDSDVRTRE